MDDYAQALRKLFKKAYSTELRGEPEADSMGRTVLANQFVSGLQTELKSKVVGTEGNLEQLLVKARFEEAKRRELAANRTLQSLKKPAGKLQGPAKKPAGTSTTPNTTETSTWTERGNWSCYKCGGAGHIARYCPDPRRPKGDREALEGKGTRWLVFRQRRRETIQQRSLGESSTRLNLQQPRKSHT